ncbi:MAG: pyridoxal-phosphate dependent enzyme [Fimbriimonas sp.]|nr:pyridoxal-phosphate dependent enzyme [Fimbriimonas sp.]
MNTIEPRPTTFLDATGLIPRSEVKLVIATETFQHTGSFKFRAAYQVAMNVPQSHVIAASSGNFGQALAFACRLFGKRCTVVMPNTSAQVKVDAVRSYGAEADLIDTKAITREARVAELAAIDPDIYVSSAFDDPWVISGNSTLGVEIMERYPDVENIVAPVGGGGLTSGLVLAVSGDNRPVNVIGAEPKAGNDAARSFREGRLVTNDFEPDTIADGARTKSLGKRNWEILHSETGLQGIVEVTDDEIREAVRALFLRLNLKVEPTGALAVAAVMANPERFMTGRTVCCVVSGGNVDPAVYAQILLGN